MLLLMFAILLLILILKNQMLLCQGLAQVTEALPVVLARELLPLITNPLPVILTIAYQVLIVTDITLLVLLIALL